MVKFSDRIGVTKSTTELQLNEVNDDLRNTLINFIMVLIGDPDNVRYKWKNMLIYLYSNHFKFPLEDIQYKDDFDCKKILLGQLRKAPWHELYNIIEVIMNHLGLINQSYYAELRIESLNLLLGREFSGYRFINQEFVPITIQEEVDSIKEALEVPGNKGLKSIGEHISKAISLLSKKPDPDYHNSIKESISAVEGVCKLLTGEKSGGIKDAIRLLSAKIPIHQSLQDAYIKLYGYTSDEDGIRHPMLEDSSVGFAEAKYMLVSCSAFVNYIIDNASKVKLI